MFFMALFQNLMIVTDYIIYFIILIDVIMFTVEQALEQQRERLDFSSHSLAQFLYGPQFYNTMKQYLSKKPIFPFDFNMFNRGRIQVMRETIKIGYMPYINTVDYMSDDIEALYLFLNCLNQMPGSIHTSMFMRCIKIMGSQEQKKEFIEKSGRLQIVGCYAQTQLAHGSDISSLMTTATLDEQTDQFVVNTPKIEAAKFWPGDLGIFSTHALVYARLIIKGKQHGINAFIVPLRDPETMKPLKGVDVGDIGPKIGFPSKDNGYLLMDNVRIPRKYMLSKFTSVDKNGNVTSQGNPKVAYATMMEIRKHISTGYPKIYAVAITIAARYSIFRRQFKNKNRQEIKIMDYQLQQDKILSRIAQYYAITFAGNKINELCRSNLQNILQKNDFSLMTETHICLSIGKPFISELVYNGMEICRKACGGHGFSQYSGFPFLINEYSANLTIQGQNTVLYLQIARYLLKNYQKSLDPDASLSDSVAYLRDFNTLLSRICPVQHKNNWTLEEIRVLIVQSVYHNLSKVSEKMMNRQDSISPKDVWNKKVGINLKELAVAHSIYFLFINFKSAIDKQPDTKIKELSTQLCMLFGINMLLNSSVSLIENGQIRFEQMESLREQKQSLLEKLRPATIGLVDGFGIPDKYIRSALIKGNPYENFLQLARRNELNHQKLESVDIVKGLKLPQAKL